MEHVVFYTAADGSPAYRRTANLDDAVRVVEHLRNAEGREEVHVYSLASVALNFRPYYRVELNANAAVPAQPEAPLAPAAIALAPPQPVQQAPAEFAEFAEFAADPADSVAPQHDLFAVPEQVAAPQAPLAPPAPPAAPAPDPMGSFLPMNPTPQATPPAPEQLPAMAAAGQPADGEDVDQNGQRGARGLGFFTR